jgi:hypothetical protein
MAKQSTKRPPNEVPRTRYEDDLYTWVEEQFALLRAGRLSEVDALNVAEERSDAGNEQLDKFESALAVLTQHLLTWDHRPDKRSRSWVLTLREQRQRIDRVLRKNPGLKPKIPEAMKDGYAADGQDRALGETDLPEDRMPETCPYTFEQIMTRKIEIEA